MEDREHFPDWYIKHIKIAFLSTSTLTTRSSKYITPFTKIPVEVSRSYIYSMQIMLMKALYVYVSNGSLHCVDFA